MEEDFSVVISELAEESWDWRDFISERKRSDSVVFNSHSPLPEPKFKTLSERLIVQGVKAARSVSRRAD